MTEPSKHIIGIDFGTSNSYCCRATLGVIRTTPIYFDNSRKTISTSILYDLSDIHNGEPSVRAFGDTAEEEWGLALPSERKHLRLHKLFKPDITDTQQAAEDARRFFRLMASYLQKNSLMPGGVNPADCHVLIGVPADSPDGFETALKGAARDAFGDVQLVPEPLGALVYHLAAQKDVTPKDVRRGIIVVDFGGGTCDIAYLLRLDIQAAWGDAFLGGRLFDDLFYQWFIEANPGAEKQLRRDNNEYFVHWVLCREMKERFSGTMSRDRNAAFTSHISVGDCYYGALQKVSWSDFMRRARSYTPSRQLFDLVPALKDRCPRLSGPTTDLVDWFTSVLESGIRRHGIRIDEVSWIILTGGSSSWPFVADILLDRFRIDGSRILRSPDPQATVAEGIALLPVLKDVHADIRRKLLAEKDLKIEEINDAVEDVIETFLQSVTSDIIARLVSETVLPTLRTFAGTGGTVNELKSKLEWEIQRYSPKIKTFIDARTPELRNALMHKVVSIVQTWFRENQLPGWEPGEWAFSSSSPSLSAGSGTAVDDPLFQLLSVITTITATAVSAALMGGAGVALLMKGPLGLIVGAVLAGLGAAGVFVFGKKKIQSWTGSIPLPAHITKWVFREKKLQKTATKIREDARKDLYEYLSGELKNMRERIRSEIEKGVEEQIQNLEILDQIEPS